MKQSEGQKLYLKKLRNKKIFIVLMQIVILGSIILLWQILTDKGILNSFIYSSPLRVLKTVKSLALSGELFSHILTTLYEILIAFVLGISLGFIIATLFYLYSTLAKIFDPFLTVLNSLPKVALGPIIIIIAGANIKSIILMALFINLMVSIISIHNGFLAVNATKVKMFKTFGASKWQMLLLLVIPSSYQNIIASFKLNISLTLIGITTCMERTFYKI